MKKAVILTAIWAGIALVPSGLYLNHVRIRRENDAIQIRDQYQLLRNAFIQGDYTNALASYFTPAYRSRIEGSGLNFPKFFGWITNLEYMLDPRAKVSLSGDIGVLYPTRSEGTPDVCVELQKINGRWLFNGEIIPIVD
jgi:hypothetical protein